MFYQKHAYIHVHYTSLFMHYTSYIYLFFSTRRWNTATCFNQNETEVHLMNNSYIIMKMHLKYFWHLDLDIFLSSFVQKGLSKVFLIHSVYLFNFTFLLKMHLRRESIIFKTVMFTGVPSVQFFFFLFFFFFFGPINFIFFWVIFNKVITI